MGELIFRDINKQEDLHELREILLSIDLADSVKRKRQIQSIIEFCSHRETRLRERLQIRFLNESIRAYVLGLDEAAIYYSALSIELILLSKLFTKTGKYDPKTMSSVQCLIRECKNQGILDENQKQIADEIRKLRNCYIHYDNWIGYTRLVSLEITEFIKHYRDGRLKEKDRQLALKAAKGVDNLLEQVFPTMESSIPQPKRRFMEERRRKYEKWLQDQGVTIVDVAKMNEEEHRRFGRSKFDALTSIQNCVKLLQSLNP